MIRTQINIILDAIRKPIEEKLGLDLCPLITDNDHDLIYDVLGFGGNGFVLKTNTDNLVIKITQDEYEINSLLTAKEQNLKGYVNILDHVFRIGNYINDFYIYWREEVTPIPYDTSSQTTLPVMNFEAVSVLRRELKNNKIEFSKANIQKKKLMLFLLEEIVEYDNRFENVVYFIKESFKKSLYVSDIKINNMGLALSDDKYVIFDSRLEPPINDAGLMQVYTLPYLIEDMKSVKYYLPFEQKFNENYLAAMEEIYLKKYGEFDNFISPETSEVLMRKLYNEKKENL